jgi:hypothetical protein
MDFFVTQDTNLPIYNIKMLLKVVFDLTVFVKFKISNNKPLMKHIHNNQNSIEKSIPAYVF